MEFAISYSGAGFSNRIFSLCTALYQMNFDETKVSVKWPRSDCMDCEFDQLFIPWSHIPIPANASVNGEWRLLVKNDDETVAPWFGVVTRHFDPDRQCKYINCEYERTPQLIREKYLQAFNFLKLRIQPTIREECTHLLNQLNGDFVGIHMRTWVDAKNRQSWFDFGEFCKEVCYFIGQNYTNFYIASDCLESKQKLKSVILSKLATAVVVFVTNQAFPGSKYALIDTMVLSSASHIIGSAFSTLTELAWWFGDCLPNVVIPTGGFETKITNFQIVIEKANSVQSQLLDFFCNVQKEAFCIDVDCGIGCNSIPILKKGFRSIAIDPIYSNYRSFKSSLRRNDLSLQSCVSICGTVSNVKDCWKRIYINPNGENQQYEYIAKEDEPKYCSSASNRYFSTQCFTIDEILSNVGWAIEDVRLLLINVQGHELLALQGAKNLLGSAKIFGFIRLIITYNSTLFARYSTSGFALLSFILKEGYYVQSPLEIKTLEQAKDFSDENRLCNLTVVPLT